MSILAGLIGLLGLLFFLVTPVGVIAPSLFKNKKTGVVPRRLHFAFGGIAASFIAFAIAGALLPDAAPNDETGKMAEIKADHPAPSESKPAQSASIPAATAQEVEKDLGITPDQYADHFNASMKAFDQPFRMKPKVESGPVNDTFTAHLNDRLAIIASIVKDTGKVRSVMLMGNGDGTAKSGLDVMSVALATISAAFPDLDRKQIGPEVMHLIKAVDTEADGQAERTLNGLKMYYVRNDVMGNVFGVEPIK